MLKKLNRKLDKFNNILNLIGIFTAIIALFISMQAFRISNEKADLFLVYQVYDVDKYDNFYENEKGQLKLKNGVGFDGNKDTVTMTRPGGEINMSLENRGNVAAKNPVINFRFINMEYANLKSDSEWKGITHNQGIGTWQEIRWQPSDNAVIHPGIPITFKKFAFNNSKVYEDAYIEVIISADNAKTRSFKIPVEISSMD